MCAGACFWAQIGTIIFGVNDEKRGVSLISKQILHPRTIIRGGILAEEAKELMIDFFRKKRNKHRF
jgi:tRNA(adenine34) deaminase